MTYATLFDIARTTCRHRYGEDDTARAREIALAVLDKLGPVKSPTTEQVFQTFKREILMIEALVEKGSDI